MKAVEHHVAHLNRGILRHDWDDPRVAEFVDNLDRVNAIAARSEGFVWRLEDEAIEAEQADPTAAMGAEPRLAYTLSVWENAKTLEAFVHQTVHGVFLERRAEWFEPAEGPAYVIWPIAKGHCPTLAEGRTRLDRLAAEGPSHAAYDFAYLKAAVE